MTVLCCQVQAVMLLKVYVCKRGLSHSYCMWFYKLHWKRASRYAVLKCTWGTETSVMSRQLHITFEFVHCNVRVRECMCLWWFEHMYFPSFSLSFSSVGLVCCHHVLSLLSFCPLPTTLFPSLCAVGFFHHSAHLSASLRHHLVILCLEQDAVVLQSCGDRNVCQQVECSGCIIRSQGCLLTELKP